MKIEIFDEGRATQAWTLENDFLSVRLARQGLELSVTDKQGGKVWKMTPEREGFLIQKAGIQLKKPLADLQLLEWRKAREGDFAGVELMSVPKDAWQVYNVRVRVLLRDNAPELVISVAPHEDPGHTADTWVREIYYPRSFEHAASPKAHTVIPLEQGILMPGDLAMNLTGEDMLGTFAPWSWNACTGPWWGHVDAGGAAYLAVIETPDDASFDFAHPAGGPTSLAPRWLTSFEAFRYQRKMLYRFYPQADYVKLALAYREYCQKIKRWRSLEEKVLEKPQLAKLPGAIGFGKMALLVHLHKSKIHREFTPFAEIAKMAEALAGQHPGETVFLNLRGWQALGYDHAHPAACPPSPEAGGWEGMRQVSETAAKHGMIFSLHEQYRDYFYSSPFWAEERTRKDSRRDSPRHHYWAGGTQSILCPKLMLEYVKMNVQQLIDQHIKPDATYQDVLTAIPLEECYDHAHPVSRSECREARYAICEYYRTLGWLLTSENASDWAAPVLDSMPLRMPAVLHGECGGQVPGVPVPLYSLVYHDGAVLTSLNAKFMPPLPAALWGINTFRAEDRLLRRLNKATAFMPMTVHRFLSDDMQEQETVFGDAVTVRVNLAKESYNIKGLPGEKEIAGQLKDGAM